MPLRGASRQACHAGTSCGACRQACHAGGHAGRATQSRPVRELQTPSSPHDRAPHLYPPPLLFLSPCPPCPLWFAFSVPSVSSVVCFSPWPPCRVRCGAGFVACGRLSSRRGHPLPSASLATDRSCGPCSTPLSLPHRHFLWSKPPGLPCRPLRGASRQACHAGGHAGRATQSRTVRKSNPIRRQDWRRGTQDCALHFNPPSRVGADQRVRLSFTISVFSVVCFSPCPPCPPWFVFSVFSVVCLLRAIPTPSHNDPQIFFPFLFNHLPTPPFSSSCSPLVC